MKSKTTKDNIRSKVCCLMGDMVDYINDFYGYEKVVNIMLHDTLVTSTGNAVKNTLKDLYRQNKIINHLQPNEFWRYNEQNKKMEQIL